MMDSLFPPFIERSNDPRLKPLIIDFALMYAKEGLRVLPLHTQRFDRCTCGNAECRNIAKHPITHNGAKDATCDSEQIRTWWRHHPYANVGVATGQGLLVVDIDPRHGGSLEALNALVTLPPTALLRTGGGGLHLYFSYDPALTVRNSAGKLAPGIDVRGENGYVVAPPSVHANGNRYRWEQRPDGYTPAPSALLDLLLERKPAQPPINPPVFQESTPPANDPPTQKSAPPANDPLAQKIVQQPKDPAATSFIGEGKRNSTLVSLAGSLRNQGANAEALFVVLQAYNQACCRPPLSEAEVRQICKSAANWTPAANGPVVRETLAVKHVASLMKDEHAAPPWAIPGLLPEGVSLLAGKPKMGKSWLALSLALSIACGGPALGRLPSKQGTVLYLGLEDNVQRICSRVNMMLQNGRTPETLFWSGSCAPLTMGGLGDLEAWITSVEHPRLIVIDTLARVRAHTGGSSGSVYADDYAAITPLKQLAEQYHLSILLVHHLRKAEASDPMDGISGSTGLTGATDCNMVLHRERGVAQAALHITGRDVEDQELKLTFDTQHGLWSIVDEPGQGETLSVMRQSIVTLLMQHETPLGPLEIARKLGLDHDVVRQKLSLMKKDGHVFSPRRGMYQATPPHAQ